MCHNHARKLKIQNLIWMNGVTFVFRFLDEEKAAEHQISSMPLKRIQNKCYHHVLKFQMAMQKVWQLWHMVNIHLGAVSGSSSWQKANISQDRLLARNRAH
jgi:hypothetical protein